MASRPIFVPMKKSPYVDIFMPEFTWNAGFAVSQKQKNIVALHETFQSKFPNRKLLEISSKSLQELGRHLSAFHLMKYVPSIQKYVPVECIYQGGKVFATGGPYTDLYEGTPKAAKKDSRLQSSGMLRSFYFEGTMIPLQPKSAFYNWLYINALLENPKYAEGLLQYDSFTDIEFNPRKGNSCQAEAAAVFVSLSHQGLVEQCKDIDRFLALFSHDTLR